MLTFKALPVGVYKAGTYVPGRVNRKDEVRVPGQQQHPSRMHDPVAEEQQRRKLDQLEDGGRRSVFGGS
jgi:hypothetical protein